MFIKPFNEFVNEATTSWSKMMKGVRSSESGPWSIVAIENKKVVGQKIDIKIQDMIPAHYEAMRKEYPKAKIHIEDGTGAVVWNESTVNEEDSHYMFFGNLKTIQKDVNMLLSLPQEQVEAMLANGHDWAADHIATSKDDIEEVANFFSGEISPIGESFLDGALKAAFEDYTSSMGKFTDLQRTFITLPKDRVTERQRVKNQLIEALRDLRAKESYYKEVLSEDADFFEM